MRIQFRPFPILPCALVLLWAVVLVGCQPKAPSAETMAEKVGVSGDRQKTSEEGSADLPSMSGYTLKKSEDSMTTDGAEGDSPDGSKAEALRPGQYCFHKAGNENWLSIRLQVSEDQQITGESAGTVNHPQQGETRYQQTFEGKAAGAQAQVEVTTYIAEITESRPEAWLVSADQLDMGRVVIEKADCPEISANF